MKRFVIIVVTLLAVAGLATTSLAAQGAILKGVKGGLNFAKFTGPDAGGLDTKTGFAFGGFVRIPLSPNVSIQPEVLYTRKGAKTSGYLEDVMVEFKLNHDYVEIPILVKVAIPTEGQVTPTFFAGPAIGFKTAAKAKVEASVGSVSGSGDIDISNAADVDFGLAFGGGADFATTNFTIVLDVRYTLGLTKVYDDTDPWDESAVLTELPISDSDTGIAPDVKNGAFTVMVGIGF